MRSELKEYYSKHAYNKNIVISFIEKIVLIVVKGKFRKIPLGSEQWIKMQHMISNLPPCYFESKIRSIFYEVTMQEKCLGEFYCLPHVCLDFPERIKIGYNVFINRNVNIVARAQIIIGNNVLIGPNTIINSGSHKYSDKECLIREQGHKSEPIIIGNDVFIGGNVFILPGVIIGDGAVVGAGSVVTKNIAPYSVVAGIPAKMIKQR